MKAGELRHRITLEQPSETQDKYGEVLTSWTTLATVYARKEDLTGRELFQAQQVNASVSTRFTIRHRPGLTAKLRVNHGGTIYNIESIQDPDGRSRQIVLICSRDG